MFLQNTNALRLLILVLRKCYHVLETQTIIISEKNLCICFDILLLRNNFQTD